MPGTQWEQFDANLANALDMQGGGVYSPQASVIIGGAPGVYLELDLPARFGDNFLMTGSLFEAFATTILIGETGSATTMLGDTFDVDVGIVNIGVSGANALTVHSFATFDDIVIANGAAFFYAATEFNAAVDFDAATDFGADAFFHDGTVTMGASGATAFIVNSSTTHEETVVFNGAIFINDTAAFSVAPSFANGAVMQGPVTFSGQGRVTQRQIIGGDTDATYQAIAQSHVHVPASVLSASRSYTIGDTGALDGDRVRFSTYEATYPLVVKAPGGAPLTNLKLASAFSSWCDVERIGGIWRIVGNGITA